MLSAYKKYNLSIGKETRKCGLWDRPYRLYDLEAYCEKSGSFTFGLISLSELKHLKKFFDEEFFVRPF